jgi:hypothetical protein
MNISLPQEHDSDTDGKVESSLAPTLGEWILLFDDKDGRDLNSPSELS